MSPDGCASLTIGHDGVVSVYSLSDGATCLIFLVVLVVATAWMNR